MITGKPCIGIILSVTPSCACKKNSGALFTLCVATIELFTGLLEDKELFTVKLDTVELFTVLMDIVEVSKGWMDIADIFKGWMVVEELFTGWMVELFTEGLHIIALFIGESWELGIFFIFV